MSIVTNLENLHLEIPRTVQLVCVSKFHPDEALMEAYQTGERIFGESRVQEMTGKYERLPKDIEWHFIGHLQKNKIKNIAPFVHLIHGVDSFELLSEINKQALKTDRVISCLLQIHIPKEDTKFGFSEDEIIEMLEEGIWKSFHNIKICGLMGMATYTNDKIQVSREFTTLHQLFKKIKNEFFATESTFKEISMGMSDDFHQAIDAGSTMVRVGSLIFGSRVV
jgi:pyridoxal phosphate enzyme (YggS family)